jgi:hypothetical protein
VNFLRRLALQGGGGGDLEQLASRCCWNRARRWHASDIVSFLVGLRTYQHPRYYHCLQSDNALILLLQLSNLDVLWLIKCKLLNYFLGLSTHLRANTPWRDQVNRNVTSPARQILLKRPNWRWASQRPKIFNWIMTSFEISLPLRVVFYLRHRPERPFGEFRNFRKFFSPSSNRMWRTIFRPIWFAISFSWNDGRTVAIQVHLTVNCRKNF